jgi:hypothetical protein
MSQRDDEHTLIQPALSECALVQMSFFFKHLEQKWSIKKRNDVYVLKQRDGSKLAYTPSHLANVLAVASKTNSETPSDAMNEIKRTQLLTFLHNALEGGWNIKKQFNASNTCNNYVFVKRHNGQYKMYEDDEYLTQFMKNNLSLES